MDELRFEGRVAIVTGAGRGIGRAHAMLLAERGAAVIVNDPGGPARGSDGTTPRAETTARDIRVQGGSAIPNFGDVSSEQDANRMVADALEHFGRIDIVVNNAGYGGFRAFSATGYGELKQMLDVHVGGSFLVTRAAWPHMVAQGYGRVVMTSSSSMIGMTNLAHYAAAKGGVFGLMRALSEEGRPSGILVNAIWPSAVTDAMYEVYAGDDVPDDGFVPGQMAMPPELVAPPVAWLVHEDCEVTGELLHVGHGVVWRVFVAGGPSFKRPNLSIEDVRDHWAEICVAAPAQLLTTGVINPTDRGEW
jgi:NAD(P)-dependent dehydrogenase (short-subunit alcohol dehydrogenase family)